MKIKTMLRLSTVASTTIAVVILLAIMLTGRQTNEAVRRSGLYSELITKVFALDVLLNDYLLHPEERERIQWQSVYGSLGELLDNIEVHQPDEEFHISFIRQNHQELSSLFFQLDAVPERYRDETRSPQEIVARQLLMKLDYMVAEASKLAEESQERIMTAQQHAGTLIVFLLTVMILGTGTILLLTGNKITDSLAELQHGTKIISDGNFDHQIHVGDGDEIGEVARAFNKMAGNLKETYVALRSEIAERRQTEEALRIDEARLETLFKLSQITEASERQIAEFALEQELKLTNSKIGMIGLLNEDESALTLHTWSKAVTEECAIKEKTSHLPVDGAGLWAEVVRTRKPLIVNDYSDPHYRKKGYPTGHVPLHRFMAIPVFEGNRIAAVAAVGNKEQEYDPADLRQFTLLMDGMWKIVQRERAEAALREAERLAAMGRALSSVAHDIKTPLVAIGGFTRQVQKHMARDNPNRQKLDIVIKETQRLENMVKDMLDFSRPLELHRSREDVEQMVVESLAMVECTAQEKNVRVRSQSSRDLAPCFLDASRMKQVIINLVMNAIQASPEGETVTISSYVNGSNLVLDVVDCGCGIPADQRETVFSPFFTTKKEGTGLGLPIVKKIIEAHAGNLQVLDNPNGGMTFRVTLPLE